MTVVAQPPTGEPVQLEFTLNGTLVEVGLRSDMTMLELPRDERGRR